jgi:hypothetical protein
MRTSFCLLLLLLLAWGATGTVRAQYTLPARVVGNGGTAASGGSYTLLGTAGQAAVGPATGGAYTGRAGFWPQVTSADALPALLSVVTPAPGIQWLRGTTYAITWTSQGLPPDAPLRIYLKRGTQAPVLLNNTVLNDGSYDWTIPADYPASDSFRILIRSKVDASIYDWSEFFTVTPGPIVPRLTVYEPMPQDVWVRGAAETIRWTSQALPPGALRIVLQRKGYPAEVLDPAAADDGVFDWTVPAAQTEGTNYRVQVRSVEDNTIFDWSGQFTVSAAPLAALAADTTGEEAPAEAALDTARVALLAATTAEPLPEAYALLGNYPNPFNPRTVIRYALPEAAAVRLVVYDVLGRPVAHLVDGEQGAGYHAAPFDAGSLPSGVYFYRIEAGPFSAVQSMLLVK